MEDVLAVVLIALWVIASLWGINEADLLTLVLCLGLFLAVRAVVRRVFPSAPPILGGVRFRKPREAE